MSIGTDVARIKGNITAALAAIADKGVTVPDGSTSDALAELIASIEAGGGVGTTYTGSFSYESDETWPSIPLESTGGKMPEWVAVACESKASETNKLRIGLYHNKRYSSSTFYMHQDHWMLYQTTYAVVKDKNLSTDMNTSIDISGGYSVVKCYAGDVYTWVAWGEIKT